MSMHRHLHCCWPSSNLLCKSLYIHILTSSCAFGVQSHAWIVSRCRIVQGVFVDSQGYVAEGSVMNIGIITQEGELVVPPFEHALAGCTLKRLLHLVQEARSESLWALPPFSG